MESRVRRFINNPLAYYGVGFLNWFLLVNLCLHFLEVLLQQGKTPNIPLIVPTWSVIIFTISAAYVAALFYVRFWHLRHNWECWFAFLASGFGCFLIPALQLYKLRQSTAPVGSLDEAGVRIVYGCLIPDCVSIFVLIATSFELLRQFLQRRKTCSR